MDSIFEWIVAIFIIISFLSSLFKAKPVKNPTGGGNIPPRQSQTNTSQSEVSSEGMDYDTFPSYDESRPSETPEATTAQTHIENYETINYRFGGSVKEESEKSSAVKKESLPGQPNITQLSEVRKDLLQDLAERFKNRDEVRAALIMSELLAKPKSIRKR